MGGSKEEVRTLLNMAREKRGREREKALLDLLELCESAEIYNELGSYYKDVDAKKGIECLKKSLAMNPKAAAPYNNLAKCYFNLAKKDVEHREEYRQLIVENLEKAGVIDGTGYLNLGRVYTPGHNTVFAGDYDLAAQYYIKVPKHSGLSWVKAMLATGDYYKEKADYLRAAAYYGLAYNFRTDDENAKAHYESVIGLVENPEVWNRGLRKLKTQSEVEPFIAKYSRAASAADFDSDDDDNKKSASLGRFFAGLFRKKV